MRLLQGFLFIVNMVTLSENTEVFQLLNPAGKTIVLGRWWQVKYSICSK